MIGSKQVPPTTATPSQTKWAWSQTDRRLMARALELAEKGVGLVSPGPLVGCVVAHGDKILGEGFYVFEDIKHAETLALEQAGEMAEGATAYVSLEPHAHHGRTPPCTDTLIAAGISRVVAPIEDPNPKVSGSGFAHLSAVGVGVEIGLMAEEAERINEKYLHFTRTGRPFVHLKLAMSLDGKIATRTGDSRWITGERSRARVHELRHDYDAILIGSGTAIADDPLLTDRSGRPRRRPLVRVLLDEILKLSPESQLARTIHEAPVLVFAGSRPEEDGEMVERGDREKTVASLLEARGVEIVRDSTDGRDLLSILNELGSRSIQSVLIEGGAGVAGKFLDAGLVNKITVFIAPMIIGGREAPNAIGGTGAESIADALQLSEVEVIQRDADLEITGYLAASEE
jgi:diaminohydroxyphosphoribosylaminopyrimidine deaminase / 5-amino-6-(5-phosphoribosylamino)uracil reductase